MNDLMRQTFTPTDPDVAAMLKAPRKTVPRFYVHSEHDEEASLAQGRKVCRDVEMVEIRWVGDAKRNLHAPAHDRSAHSQKLPDGSKRFLSWAEWFRDEYDQFAKGIEQIGSGTPLAEMSTIGPSRKSELQSLNIFTVEQLANLGTVERRRLGMAADKLQAAAKEFLLKIQGESSERLLRDELSKRDEALEAMQREIEELRHATSAPAAPDSVANQARESSVDDEYPELRAIFEDMEDADIRNWMKDNGGSPAPNAKRETLVKRAVELGAKLERESKARAA